MFSVREVSATGVDESIVWVVMIACIEYNSQIGLASQPRLRALARA